MCEAQSSAVGQRRLGDFQRLHQDGEETWCGAIWRSVDGWVTQEINMKSSTTTKKNQKHINNKKATDINGQGKCREQIEEQETADWFSREWAIATFHRYERPFALQASDMWSVWLAQVCPLDVNNSLCNLKGHFNVFGVGFYKVFHVLYAFQQMKHNCYPAGGFSFSMLFPLLSINNTHVASCESLWNINIEILKDFQQFLSFVLISVVMEKHWLVDSLFPHFISRCCWSGSGRHVFAQTGRLTLLLSSSTDSRDWNGSLLMWQNDALIRTLAFFGEGVPFLNAFSAIHLLWIFGSLLIYMTMWVLLFLERNNSAPVLHFSPLHADRLVWEEHSGVRPCSEIFFRGRSDLHLSFRPVLRQMHRRVCTQTRQTSALLFWRVQQVQVRMYTCGVWCTIPRFWRSANLWARFTGWQLPKKSTESFSEHEPNQHSTETSNLSWLRPGITRNQKTTR